MPEGKKAYYQVSFTGAQALAAVVVMIAALGAAFFLGSKAGFEKSGESEPPPARAAASAPATAPSAAAPSSEASSAPAPEASTSSEEAPVFEDREAGVAEPPAAGRASSSAPSRTEIAAPAPSGGAPAKGSPARPAPAAAPAPAKPEPEKSAAAKTGYFVQIVSTSSKSEANRWKEKLAAKKYRTAAVSSVESKKGTLWRVRVGPYADKEQAKKAAAKITAEFKQKAWVAPE
jgi:cell division septation protein DedD